MRGLGVSASASGARITAPAPLAASLSRWRGCARNVISSRAARSSEPTWRISVCGSPAMRPPRCEAISPSVSGPRISSLRGWLAFERLDHPVGDVDARARENRVLEDDVELLLLGDLPDDAVAHLDDLRQLLVAALVEVLAVLALLALELAVEVAELALLGAPRRLGHGHGVLLQVLLRALELLGHLGELLLAPLRL